MKYSYPMQREILETLLVVSKDLAEYVEECKTALRNGKDIDNVDFRWSTFTMDAVNVTATQVVADNPDL